jgi:hypothetical protein
MEVDIISPRDERLGHASQTSTAFPTQADLDVMHITYRCSSVIRTAARLIDAAA